MSWRTSSCAIEAPHDVADRAGARLSEVLPERVDNAKAPLEQYRDSANAGKTRGANSLGESSARASTSSKSC